MTPRRFRFGYNIIEMAIALVVLGLLLGGVLAPLQVRFQQEQIHSAKAHMASAKAAVLAYALQNKTVARKIQTKNRGSSDAAVPAEDNIVHDIPAGRPYLPCPDVDGDGLEDRAGVATDAIIPATALTVSGGDCREQKGALPWKTLGVVGADPWGGRLTYWVDMAFSNRALGFDESMRADIFDRRKPFNYQNGYSFRDSPDMTGAIVCANFIDDGAASGDCPRADGKNVLAGVVTTVAITIGARRLAPHDPSSADAEGQGVVDGAAFVIVSHGGNGLGALNRDNICREPPALGGNLAEAANAYYRPAHVLRSAGGAGCDPAGDPANVNLSENLFVSAPISKVSDDNFHQPDDIVVWVGGNEIFGFLARGGALPVRKLEFLPE